MVTYDTMDMKLSNLPETAEDRGARHATALGVTKSQKQQLIQQQQIPCQHSFAVLLALAAKQTTSKLSGLEQVTTGLSHDSVSSLGSSF